MAICPQLDFNNGLLMSHILQVLSTLRGFFTYFMVVVVVHQTVSPRERVGSGDETSCGGQWMISTRVWVVLGP